MNKNLGKVVAALVDAQKQLSVMSSEERMIIGEKVAFALRHACVLNRFQMVHRNTAQSCDIESGPLRITINASFDPSDLEIPF